MYDLAKFLIKFKLIKLSCQKRPFPLFLSNDGECRKSGYFCRERPNQKTHSGFMFKNIRNILFSISSKNEILKGCSILEISEVKNRKQSKTCGFTTLLELKFNIRVMIITNIERSMSKQDF